MTQTQTTRKQPNTLATHDASAYHAVGKVGMKPMIKQEVVAHVANVAKPTALPTTETEQATWRFVTPSTCLQMNQIDCTASSSSRHLVHQSALQSHDHQNSCEDPSRQATDPTNTTAVEPRKNHLVLTVVAPGTLIELKTTSKKLAPIETRKRRSCFLLLLNGSNNRTNIFKYEPGISKFCLERATAPSQRNPANKQQASDQRKVPVKVENVHKCVMNESTVFTTMTLTESLVTATSAEWLMPPRTVARETLPTSGELLVDIEHASVTPSSMVYLERLPVKVAPGKLIGLKTNAREATKKDPMKASFPCWSASQKKSLNLLKYEPFVLRLCLESEGNVATEQINSLLKSNVPITMENGHKPIVYDDESSIVNQTMTKAEPTSRALITEAASTVNTGPTSSMAYWERVPAHLAPGILIRLKTNARGTPKKNTIKASFPCWSDSQKKSLNLLKYEPFVLRLCLESSSVQSQGNRATEQLASSFKSKIPITMENGHKAIVYDDDESSIVNQPMTKEEPTSRALIAEAASITTTGTTSSMACLERLPAHLAPGALIGLTPDITRALKNIILARPSLASLEGSKSINILVETGISRISFGNASIQTRGTSTSVTKQLASPPIQEITSMQNCHKHAVDDGFAARGATTLCGEPKLMSNQILGKVKPLVSQVMIVDTAVAAIYRSSNGKHNTKCNMNEVVATTTATSKGMHTHQNLTLRSVKVDFAIDSDEKMDAREKVVASAKRPLYSLGVAILAGLVLFTCLLKSVHPYTDLSEAAGNEFGGSAIHVFTTRLDAPIGFAASLQEPSLIKKPALSQDLKSTSGTSLDGRDSDRNGFLDAFVAIGAANDEALVSDGGDDDLTDGRARVEQDGQRDVDFSSSSTLDKGRDARARGSPAITEGFYWDPITTLIRRLFLNKQMQTTAAT